MKELIKTLRLGALISRGIRRLILLMEFVSPASEPPIK